MTGFLGLGGSAFGSTQDEEKKPKESTPQKQEDPHKKLEKILTGQQKLEKILADQRSRKMEDIQKAINVRSDALNVAAQESELKFNSEIQSEAIRSAKSDTDLQEVKNRALELTIGQQVEETLGIPMDDFMGSQLARADDFRPVSTGENLQALMKMGITPTSRAIEELGPGLVERANTEKEGTFLSGLFGLPLDLIGTLLRPVVDLPTGKDVFGVEPSASTIVSRLERLQDLSVKGASPGLAFAKDVGGQIIAGQTEMTRLFTQVELAKMGFDQETIRNIVGLESDLAKTAVEADRAALAREGFGLEKEKFEETKRARKTQEELDERKFQQIIEESRLQREHEVNIKNIEVGARGSDIPDSIQRDMFQRGIHEAAIHSRYALGDDEFSGNKGPGQLITSIPQYLALKAMSENPELSEQDREQLRKGVDGLIASGIEAAKAETPGLTTDQLLENLRGAAEIAYREEGRLAKPGPFQDLPQAAAFHKAANQIQLIAHEVEKTVKEESDERITSLTDDRSVEARINKKFIQSGDPVMARAGHTLVSIRNLMRSIAEKLGIEGPLLSPEGEASLESFAVSRPLSPSLNDARSLLMRVSRELSLTSQGPLEVINTRVSLYNALLSIHPAFEGSIFAPVR